MEDFTINEKFKRLLPQHSKIDFEALEESILKDGVKTPLIVWREQNILIDGHTRLEICQNHNLPYEVEFMPFSDEDHVVNWIIKNQFNNDLHRHLTDQQKTYLLGKLYEIEKRISAGAPRGNQNALKEEKKQCDGNHHIENDQQNTTKKPNRTREELAEKQGVSQWAVQKAREFSCAVDTLTEVIGPEVKQDILSGKVKMSKTRLTELKLVADSEPELAKKQYKEESLPKKKKPRKKKESQVDQSPDSPETSLYSGSTYAFQHGQTKEMQGKTPVSEAFKIAEVVINRMEGMIPDDPDRFDALTKIEEWIKAAKEEILTQKKKRN